MTPAQWAEKFRILGKEAAEPGPMRISRTPWVYDIAEAIANPAYREVISAQGSQTSKTDGLLLNTVGFYAHYRQKPILYYVPSQMLADAISTRLLRMFEGIPEIWNALDKRRKSKYEFFIYGIRIGLGWGGSKSQVSSHPAELVVFDELDRLEDIPGEGNPWQLTRARISTYTSGKLIGASSPTTGIVVDYTHPKTGMIHWAETDPQNIGSLTWQLWQEGTKGEYMLPCPHCLSFFAPKSKLLFLPEKASSGAIQREMRMICPHCGCAIHPNQQYEMISNGKVICPGQWVENGQRVGIVTENSVASFHVNGLCSPWVSWTERGVYLSRVTASRNKGRIQAVMNTDFGELYGDAGEAPSWEGLNDLKTASPYVIGQIPSEVRVLTAGVDVQGNRLVVVVMGWGIRENELEGWVIDYQEVIGETKYDKVWKEFFNRFMGEYQGSVIREIAIDSGYNPSKTKENPNKNIIYEFCRVHRRAIATKGASHTMNRPFSMGKIDINHRGQVIKQGLNLWTVDSSFLKMEVYSHLEWDVSLPGAWHFPSNIEDRFFKELTAERMTEKGWVKTGENHVLDAVCLNYFLALKGRFKVILRSALAPISIEEEVITHAHDSVPVPVPVVENRSVSRSSENGFY